MGPFTALLALWLRAASAPPEATTDPPAAAITVDPGCQRWLAETKILPERQWLVHVVQPSERLGPIAARYGVSREELAAWNELGSPRARVRPGKKLKVHSDRQPPPLERIVYTVAEGDTWDSLAIRHRVAVDELKIWNHRLAGRPLEVGATVKIWSDPGAPRTVYCRRGAPPPPIEYRKDAISLGHPQSGRLKNGISLPDSPLWVRGRKDGTWASTHALETMIEAFTRLRVDDGYDGEIFVGAISRRRGGKFPPHRSHRTGLDLDIRLPLLPGIATETYPSPDVIDWPALWALIVAFIDTGEVSMIFLDRNHQKRLYQTARWYGWTPEELAPILHWPRKDRKHESIVRHARGHKGHIHVRLLCGPEEGRCAPGRARVLERRGWIEPEPSGKESREGAKARREQWKAEGRLLDEGEEDDVDVGD